MDSIRSGLALRALRRRRRWTQAEAGARAGLSASAVSRIERGEMPRFTLGAIDRLATALGAGTQLRILWQGEALDRLLDNDHARLVDLVLRRLVAAGWTAEPEVTYRVGAERGAIDVLAVHGPTEHLLVIEVKSVVPDLQAMLAGLDRKARVAPAVARARGWGVGPVSRMLVLPAGRTTRRRLAAFSTTFDAALPERTIALTRWMRAPDRRVAGILFVSDMNHEQARHRVGASRRGVVHRIRARL